MDAASDRDSHESDWEDPEEDVRYEYRALHDDMIFDSLNDMLKHEQTTHGFELRAVQRAHKLDMYGMIRLVNFVRQTKTLADKIAACMAEVQQDDKWLQPVLEDDAVLFTLAEDDFGDETATAEPETVQDWKARCAQLEAQYSALQDQVRTVLTAHAGDSGIGASSSTKQAPVDNDSYYFESYAYNEIHETMLRDAVRTDAYRDAVYGNKDLFNGATVMDVGCGTGILSMFAAKAGAKHVYAIDNSSIIEKAQANAFENNLQDQITFIKGKVEDIKLPGGIKVDIIVSEWMGYALLYEAMLDSVICARDRFLKPEGLMMPSHIQLRVAGITDEEYWSDRTNYFNDVYGFKMNAMKEKQFDDILIDYLTTSQVTSEAYTFKSLDLHTVTTESLNFSGRFELQKATGLVGLLVWFDTYFGKTRDECKKLAEMRQVDVKDVIKEHQGFTTGPHGASTHWKQAVLLFKHIGGGEKQVSGELTFRKNSDNPRFLEIEAAWQSDTSPSTQTQAWSLA
ncbi:S-adenosyl-L-methionine-dependent methyltransferase [Protomyces lactucae-debilis]|uniref:type I protein arginine methyltransferase n=1 Tax=Protomyces lactucae-debilis TaxID=2754530 RepID=A0A1Y2FRZ1_PROLT|nr:S-adenosyl-L-methionine-dependent methyltransferase [Protomyces lactucae-debilis]ORY85475.1 S-adenosyl-L-methionine-dependent methyltransferase [Protomyces lactucae-debilis]